MALDEYRRKRQFQRSPEPKGAAAAADRLGAARFVVQKHAARNLHYDLRLEIDGVLKSWAVPKGPSLDPSQKRLAVHVEDHPLEYAAFEGVIPKGEYGAGNMIIWDSGVWQPLEGGIAGYEQGKLKFRMDGAKLKGAWTLVRMRVRPEEKADSWLLIKERDEFARPETEFDVLAAAPESVVSGRLVEELGNAPATLPSKPSSPARSRQELLRLAAGLHGAVKGSQPTALAPELAKQQSLPPAGGKWLHEIKLDGYRLLAYKRPKSVVLKTRRGQDWSDRFPDIAKAIAALPCNALIIDGEVVALRGDGVSSFAALQGALRDGRAGALVYFVFDVLYFDGFDLRRCALEKRKEFLRELLAGAASTLQYCDHLDGDGHEFFRQCRQRGLEGVMSKRRDRPHRSGRSDEWIKSKCFMSAEFVICGFTQPEGQRTGFGALVLGYYDKRHRLTFAGKVGTGFSEALLKDLLGKLEPIEQPKTSIAGSLGDLKPRDVRWVKPELVARIRYSGWTQGGLLWHPSFQGLREDIAPSDVTNEPVDHAASRAEAPSEKQPRPTISAKRLEELAHIRMTNPTRVLYPDDNVTKFDLAAYYASIADWILPHVVGRPLSLVRCPNGIDHACFFQKHSSKSMPDSIRAKQIDGEDHVYIVDLAGLMSLVQVSTLEIHVWGSQIDRPERPDHMVFDLDPDAAIAWSTVVDLAHRCRELLAEFGLESFVKTTGGKGLHVVVPLVRRQQWSEVKEFSEGVAELLRRAQPSLITTNMSKAARPGKIYIDFHRNHEGATSVAPYSTRARAGVAVSMPLAWDELTPSLSSGDYTIRNAADRLSKLGTDPWAGIFTVRQSLTAAMTKELARRKRRR